MPLGVVGSLESWRVNDDFNIYRVQVQVHVQVLYCVPVADAEVSPACPCFTPIETLLLVLAPETRSWSLALMGSDLQLD